MIQEEKDLLLKDLCARLPYNVIVECSIECGESIDLVLSASHIDELVNNSLIVKPYLRPLSSMTEEEHIKLKAVYDNGSNGLFDEYSHVDWLNAHHFDYRHLIKKGLAIEAPEGMYN